MKNKISELLKEEGGIRLDIGCGRNKQPGFVGMDKRDWPGVDIVHDWSKYPWPLPDESVLVAVASHVIEHVNRADDGFLRWMNELWRIMKYDGEVAIACPHALSPGYIQDPTHMNPISEATWAYFDPLEQFTNGTLYRIYTPKPWKIKHLSWSPNANVEVVLIKRHEDPSYYEE